jgi:hypothetical protein
MKRIQGVERHPDTVLDVNEVILVECIRAVGSEKFIGIKWC